MILESLQGTKKSILLLMLKQLKFRDCLLAADQRDSNLTDDKCKNLREFCDDKKKFSLTRHKDLYPFEYINGWERFIKTNLPQNAFDSRWTWKVSVIKTMNMQSKFIIRVFEYYFITYIHI